MTRIAGGKAFNVETRTVFAIYFWFNRAYRSHPMPHQLEGYKLAEQTRTDYRKWTRAMLALGGVAVFVAFWVILFLMYDYGAEGKSRITFGAEAFNNLTTWLRTPQLGKFQELMAIFIGFGIAFLLQWLECAYPGGRSIPSPSPSPRPGRSTSSGDPSSSPGYSNPSSSATADEAASTDCSHSSSA